MADNRMEFRILGPLEVRVDGASVRVGGPKQRALLALLLLSANRVVSRDRLIDELLPDHSGGGADHTLRVQVSRMRKALGPGGRGEPRLLARPPGYLLRVEPGELDLHAFEQRLAEGRRALEEGNPKRAAAKLRAAESLWRGRPLADLEFEPFARVEVERLEELRLAAAEERIDAELALGRHVALVPELEARVAEGPLRERLRGQLMLALYRCGRQADALEVYRAGRSLLIEELALDPSPALRELEQAILRQEPALELAQRRPARVATEVLAAPRPPARESPSDAPRTAMQPSRHRRRRILLGALALGVILAAVGAVITVRVSRGSRALAAVANSVGVVDTQRNAVRAVIQAGGPLGGIASGAGAVWVTDTANDLLLRIDAARGTVERIPVGHGPTGVAVADGQVWVVNQLDRTVSEINPRALRQVATIQVGNGADAVAFGAGSVWVANGTDDTISRIDPNSGAVATVSLVGAPDSIAVGREGVWVTSSSTGQLLLVDPHSNQVTQAVAIGNGPAGLAVGAGSVWVANTPEGTVSRFDPGSGNVTEINVGKSPVGVAYGDGAVWVANSLGGTVSRIDPKTNSPRRVSVGSEPTALAIAGKDVWATVLPSPASHRGGTLRVVEGPPFASVGGSLDAAVFAGIGQWQMLSLTNDGLVTYRRLGGLAGNTLVPDLATALPTPTNGGRTYTFQLRSGIHYSNGALVEPEDFRRAIVRVFRVGNSYTQSFYTEIVGAKRCAHRPNQCTLGRGIVTDDQANTVTFHLTAADPGFLYKLAFAMADAVPVGTPGHDLGRAPLPATGPYMTRSVSPSRLGREHGHQLAFRSWILVRNPRFHEWSPDAQPDGYPDRIVLTAETSPRRAVSAIERGTTDVLLSPPPNRLDELARRYTSQLHSNPLAATFALVMNTRVPPFDHLAVRRALNYAIDRNRIVAFNGGSLTAQATCQVLPPTLPGYQPYCPYTTDANPSGSWIAPNFAKAELLVRASGTRGTKVTLLVTPADPTDPTDKIGPYIVSVLDRLGYHASLDVVANVYPGRLPDSRARAQIGWFTWYQDYPAPSNFIDLLLSCRAFIPRDQFNLNMAEFCNPKIDTQIRRAYALQARDPAVAGEVWRQIDHDLVNQGPWVPLYNPRVLTALSARVGNYQYHPFWQLLLDQLWVR